MNRVTEIKGLSDPNSGHHCSGSDNPADLVTRGIDAKYLLQNVM